MVGDQKGMSENYYFILFFNVKQDILPLMSECVHYGTLLATVHENEMEQYEHEGEDVAPYPAGALSTGSTTPAPSSRRWQQVLSSGLRVVFQPLTKGPKREPYIT